MRCEKIKENVKRFFDIIDNIKLKYSIEREIKIVAASKTFPPKDILCAYEAGIKIFGENRFQEWEIKSQALNNKGIEWHFIGTIQSNKIRRMIGKFKLIQSVGKLKHLEKINRVSEEFNLKTNILLEINIGRESTKSGFFREEIDDVLKKTLEFRGVKILGFMTIPPFSEKPEDSQSYFIEMNKIFEQYKNYRAENIEIKELSMGMSNDFEYAIINGATIIRPGRVIFGERK